MIFPDLFDTHIRRRDWVVCAVLFAITFALYGPVRHFDFIHLDDPTLVSENPNVQDGLTRQSVRWACTSLVLSNYTPVTVFSVLADATVWGLRPGPAHVENAILHASSTVEWYLLWVILGGRRARSFLVAALFGLHPMHVEPVAWISGRGDMLCMLLMVATLLAYVQYIRSGRTALFVLAVLLYPIAILAKTVAMVLPVVLFLLNVWPLRRLRWVGRWRLAETPAHDSAAGSTVSVRLLVLELVPFVLLGTAGAALGLFGRVVTGVSLSLRSWTVWDRLANVVFGYCDYLFKAVWPEPMVVLYPLRHVYNAGSVVVSAGILVLLSTLIFRAGRKRPYLPVGWLWFLLTLLPTIGFVQTGGFAMADRYTYLPYVGLSVAVIWLIADAWERATSAHLAVRTPVAAAACVLIVAACAIESRRQLWYWRNSYSLFEHAEENVPDNADLANSMGDEYRYAGQPDLAFQAYSRSVAIDPGNGAAQNNLACLLLPVDAAAALPHFEQAVRVGPDSPSLRWNLGVCQQQMHRYTDAGASFRRALQLDPRFEPALRSLRSIPKDLAAK